MADQKLLFQCQLRASLAKQDCFSKNILPSKHFESPMIM